MNEDLLVSRKEAKSVKKDPMRLSVLARVIHEKYLIHV